MDFEKKTKASLYAVYASILLIFIIIVSSPNLPHLTRINDELMKSTTTSSQIIISDTNNSREVFTKINNSSHLFQFQQNNNTWTPSLDSFRVAQLKRLSHHEIEPIVLNQINSVLFHNDNDNNNNNTLSPTNINLSLQDENTKLHQFLGFVRIPKCGSTSLKNLFEEELNKPKRALNGCIYNNKGQSSPVAEEEEEEEQEEGEEEEEEEELSESESNNTTTTTTTTTITKRTMDCAHTHYSILFHHFARKSLPRLRPIDGSSDAIMTFEAVSIVRDPFNMMYSLFNYMRQGHWTKGQSMAQRQRLRANDFEGWMEHEVLSDSRTDWWSLYKYLHVDDVDEAISYMQGDVPRVLMLITECFDTSLKLLAERKPHFISRDGVDQFLQNSNLAKANAGKAAIKKWTKPSSSSSNNNQTKLSDHDLDLLRIKSKSWLADEYKFYNAAKEQFIHKLLSSNLEQSEIESCIRKLAS